MSHSIALYSTTLPEEIVYTLECELQQSAPTSFAKCYLMRLLVRFSY